ncbi:hypothetical protein BD626DRAFT_502828 [Schizophyllum amplum]|uniref:Uncharacterized protein n=1 Tax=Schizophyllum amplum TaxID=97359 RepID=A0A550C8J5_9AGAR|nr:hypothetical protein BD626DRAFT_502828 [Auriculariopsis ampla]
MDSKSATTIQALDAFIEQQRRALARTQSDLGRLHALQRDAAARPESLLRDAADKFTTGRLGLADVAECLVEVPKDIDWSLYDSHDSSALQQLTAKTKEAQAARREPRKTQCQPLSNLQQLVKDARSRIVEPVLAMYPDLESLMEPTPVEPPKPPDAATLKKQRELDKLRDMRSRRARCFIRRDADDETMDVDVADDALARHPTPRLEPDSSTASAASPSSAGLPTPPPPSASGFKIIIPKGAARQLPSDAPDMPLRPRRQRRNTFKVSALVQEQPDPEPPPASCLGKRARRRSSPAPRIIVPSSRNATPATPNSLVTPSSFAAPSSLATPSSPCASTSQLDTPTEPPSSAKRGSLSSSSQKKARPKSATYKVPWTDEEQLLLQRLLQEIPDGESFRWQKISKAMGGKRTPRQVSSRVQKYFEKLKAYGVGDAMEEDEAIDVD